MADEYSKRTIGFVTDADAPKAHLKDSFTGGGVITGIKKLFNAVAAKGGAYNPTIAPKKAAVAAAIIIAAYTAQNPEQVGIQSAQKLGLSLET